MMRKIHLLLTLFVLLLSACAAGASDTLSPSKNQDPVNLDGAQISNPVDPLAGDAPVPMGDLAIQQTPLPEAVMPLVYIAIQDLAQRLGVGLDEITVVHYEEVLWPDASLGCPQPGMDNAQVITQGLKIVFQFEEDTYSYHSDLKELVMLCLDDTETTGFVDKIDTTHKDGGPNETKDGDVIIMPPTERK